MIQKMTYVLLLLSLLLAACAPATAPLTSPVVPTESSFATDQGETEPPAGELLVIQDDRGVEITLNGPAQRIVTLGASIVEGLFAIGAGSQVVGREEYSVYPVEALDVPSIGSLFGSLPVETILALQPDLVIAPEIISNEQIEALENLQLTVYFQKNPTDFPGLYANLLALGRLTGRDGEAQALVADLTARVAAVERALAGIETRPRVFYELDATDPQNPFTAGGGTFIDTLIRMSGGENVGSVLMGEYAQISSEEIIVQDPEIILLGDAEYGITVESVAGRPGWDVIQAVQNGQIHPFDPYLVSVPGPRLVDGFETMARLIHPERFE
jgi:iron complex transport system substrate-binding protein